MKNVAHKDINVWRTEAGHLADVSDGRRNIQRFKQLFNRSSAEFCTNNVQSMTQQPSDIARFPAKG